MTHPRGAPRIPNLLLFFLLAAFAGQRGAAPQHRQPALPPRPTRRAGPHRRGAQPAGRGVARQGAAHDHPPPRRAAHRPAAHQLDAGRAHRAGCLRQRVPGHGQQHGAPDGGEAGGRGRRRRGRVGAKGGGARARAGGGGAAAAAPAPPQHRALPGHRAHPRGAQHLPGVRARRVDRLAAGQVWVVQGVGGAGVHQADPAGAGVPARQRHHPPGHQGRQHPGGQHGPGQARRLWRLEEDRRPGDHRCARRGATGRGEMWGGGRCIDGEYVCGGAAGAGPHGCLGLVGWPRGGGWAAVEPPPSLPPSLPPPRSLSRHRIAPSR